MSAQSRETSSSSIAPYRTRTSRTEAEIAAALQASPLGPTMADAANAVTRTLAVELAFVWQNFTARLDRTPIIGAIESGTITRDDYLCLLRNLRQQVIDGGRWIAHTAASMSQSLFMVRSAMIGHAAEEHRDYQMIEKNYVAAGGTLEDIEGASKNVGSEAFSSFMFHHALQADPLDLFGAMFIIEGLGTMRAGRWAEQLQATLGLPDGAVSFLAYHGKHDDGHYDKLRRILSAPFIDERVARSIVKTAKTVGRLYILQLEELDHV
jgi:3-oxoacyl-[acyl-carrier-protein] synthase-3